MNREFKIALSQEYYSDVVYLSQYDTDYDLVFGVLDKYAKASQIDGYSAKFVGTRCDGLGFEFTSTASGGSVSFRIDNTISAVAGTHRGEIIFYDGNGLLYGSANIQIVVEPAAKPDGTIDADVERAEELAEQIQEIVDTAAEQTTAQAEQIVADLETDVAQIKEDFRDLPSIKDVVEEDAELYICDANGKVLAKFADGGFQTENFSTEDLSTKAYRKNTSESSDLDVVDESGGIVLRLKDGQIETKEFSSSELANTINGIIKNIDALDDVDDYSLNNRLANPVYTTNELYNEENPNTPITPVNALYRNMDSFATNGYRIPTIVITNSGTVLVAAQHMKNEGGDFGDFGIHVARKTVNGEWTASEVIPFDTTRQDYGGCLNPEFLVDRNSGRIYLFYGTEKQKVVWWEVTTEDGDFRYVYSDDDGENWSNPVSLKSLWDTEEYDYCIPSCTKGITLTDGTLVVPCFCKKGFDGSTAYSYPLVLYKTVGGDWTFSSVVKTAIKHLDECAVVEGITPNTIWLYCRPNTNYGTGVNRGYNKFVYNISSDTFTQIPTTFDTNRHNCFGIDRITIDGTLIYLMTFTDSHTSKRENITLWASLDGDIWIRVYRILKASGNGYSVIDNHDGQIWVAYESGSAIAVQDVSVLSALISDTASNYIVRNITIQDRMQMIYNALRGIN